MSEFEMFILPNREKNISMTQDSDITKHILLKRLKQREMLYKSEVCKHRFVKVYREKSILFGLIKLKEANLICKKCGDFSGWKYY